MKAYVIVTGTIFALFAVSHVFIPYQHWNHQPDDHSIGAPAIVALAGAALAWWAWRVSRRLPVR